MTETNRFSPIRTKDPVINTFPWEGLKQSPDIVEQNYKEHAITHMSLGDTGEYLKKLKRNVTENKKASIGAIVGPYGYGKTSTAIHIWRMCQEEYGILSVPPFEWYRLVDIIEAVYGWATYKFGQGPRHLIEPLTEIYERYRDRSIEEIAEQLDLDVNKALEAYEEGTINLGINPTDVISFLMDVTELCTKDGDFTGLAVFIDELQETADKYDSIQDFQTDLFAFADKVPTNVGDLAMIFTFPDTLEANINTTRPDIIHRLKQSSLYIRVEAIYGRGFPKDLWEKYSNVFQFEEEKYKPIDKLTLDAIGQISMRKDLGAGPRTVINALVEAVKYYENMAKSYSPIDLVNGFLDGKISFEEQGKFSSSVRKAVENRIIQSKPEYIKLIKLVSAFPLGCDREKAKKYGLEIPFDKLLDSEIYGEILYRQSEGYSLRSLLEEEVSAEPTYFRLVRDNFIRSYAPDKRHAMMAMNAFRNHIIENYFEPGRSNQLDKWQWDNEEKQDGVALVIDLIGTFNLSYPERDVRILIGISPKSTTPSWGESAKELNFAFLLNYAEQAEQSGLLKFPPEENILNEVFIQLNLLSIGDTQLNLPRIDKIFPPDRMSVLFMLSLLDYLDRIEEKIPSPEKSGEVRILRERLLQYSEQYLFGDDLNIDSRFDIVEVGESLIQKVFNIMCGSLYPNYHTLITNSQWDKYIQSYMKALRDPKVTTRIARGKDSIETQKKYVANMFGETSTQRIENLITENLSDLAEIVDWGGRGSDHAEIRFLLHPMEEAILDLLEKSELFEERKEGKIKKIPVREVFDLGERNGYKKVEIGELIRILNARELITYKESQNEIEQLIRSLEDLSASIKDRLDKILETVDKLETIPDFDRGRYSHRIQDVKNKVEGIQNHEDADELIGILDGVRNGLYTYTSSRYFQYVNKLRDELENIERIIASDTPDDIKKRISGYEVPWGSVLEESRQRLKKRYDELISDYKSLAKDINSIILRHVEDDVTPDNLIWIFKEKTNIDSELEELENRKASMKYYLKNLGEWKSLLSRANNIHQDAITAQATFNDDRFIRTANQISGDIKEAFGKSSVDALSDLEKYKEKIISLEKDINNWQRKRRKTFIDKKNSVEENLGKIGDKRPSLKTNFDPYESSDENIQALMNEAREHIDEVLGLLLRSLEASLNEYKYFSEIKKVNFKLDQGSIEGDIKSIKGTIGEISEDFDRNVDLGHIAEKVNEIQDRAIEYNKSIYSALSVQEPENEFEEKLIEIVQDNIDRQIHGVELKKIFIKLMEEEEDVNFDSVLEKLIDLFKKNLVNIRIQLRGQR